MLALERQDQILEILKKEKAVKVSELSRAFGVSEMTIRRDLLKLENAGFLKRTFGGAIIATNFLNLQLSFFEKESVFTQEKKCIGLAAANLIENGDTIALSAGTTTFQIARNIGEIKELTVVTNAINIAMELANKPNIKLIVTGGSLRERSFALVGPLGESISENIHINKFFLGTTGITIEHGITTLDLLEASMYKALLKASGELIIVADNSKFGKVALASITEIENVTKIITDNGILKENIKEIRNCGVDVIVIKTER